MWSAFMNGRGGAGGGYVPSQGWEFVPCSRMERADRGRGKSRSPLRRISSPPTVFSQIYEPPFGAPPGGEAGAGTPLDILRGQMWPEAPQQQQQQQTQHSRLKKKFEDLKKRHVQDKEEWLREKETLLREVADIQGGENRRILLDLKTVLEEVQAEVKREEEKRSELQLQYTRDRCAWELEKAELKSRIAQLEAKDTAGLASGEAQAPGGPGAVASGSARERYGQTSTLRREREEQRRILVDTQTAAMDLRCRLEHNERDWLKEKSELLERFEVERREWENQLKDMQKKIEELYCEVRVKRGGIRLEGARQDDDDDDLTNRLSIRSVSTGSSLLSDNSRSEPLSSSGPSEHNIHQSISGLGHKSSISSDGGHHPTCFTVESLCEFRAGAQFTEHSQPKREDDSRPRDSWQKDSVTDAVDTAALDALFCGAPGCRVSQEYEANNCEKRVLVTPQESPLWTRLSCSIDKKKNTTALNAALKEIARVSEELCSYQDEIRKKSGDKRNRSESLCLPEDCGSDKTGVEEDAAACDLNQIYDDLRALERANWITLSPDNTWQINRGLRESWTTNATEAASGRATQISSGVDSEMDAAAPPIPPRTSSWNLSAPAHPDTELHIPDSPVATVRKCHSPCILMDRKCSSPSVVRKFEAMLQENEGKVFIDGALASCSVPANSNCNMGCCHNRWSCDVSKFSNTKLSTYGTVQKSFSEVNIRSAGKDLLSDYSPVVGNLKNPELQMPPFVRDLPVDLLLSSLETVPLSSNLKGSKRNIMLEQKTAEFNRTLFQAEMGRGVEEQSSFTPIDSCSMGHQSVFATSDEVLPPKVTKSQPLCADVPTGVVDAHREETLCLFVSESTILNPEDQLKQTRWTHENQAIQIKEETPSVVSPEQWQAAPGEAAASSQSPIQHCEVKHKVQTASSPSRKPQHRAATEAPFSECAVPANTQPGQSVDDSSLKNDNPHGAKPQPAKAGVSLQQLSAENKQKQMTQPRHVSAPTFQSDSSRPGPRMMNDHPWKPLTLAAYPRPEGSRSNYGAVERILKNYENAARAQQNQSQENDLPSSPNFSLRQEKNVTEVDTARQTQASHFTETHTSLSSHSATGVKEIQLIVQGREDSRWNT
ncbi:protein SOGA3a isoform X2 [Salarias fasciatus]|uniref:SOGA 1/2-like coiled-coil domain-containing protein n=1 Tax=Salarias fasciatus TaxID=181472 RepID=A0A672H8G3_SALFA|nr:uncharacterized protein KIAA0408 homolog isoform X2 [Salarias fasciatus]XP_029959316.1 uncharacterized protein KIAA0408 homolog isoform X2 [Salarias fasciatus]